MRICIIGAGWYGCHLARVLTLKGHEVTLLEKNNDIFSGISGSFGIRLHRGPHYPRSFETRQNCQRGYDKFHKHYPDLIVRHQSSIYSLGTTDSDGKPSKVNKEQFEAVCNEFKKSRPVNSKDWEFDNLIATYDVEEPSILLGERLRKTFWNILEAAKIKIKLNFEVIKVERNEEGVCVYGNESNDTYDYVINSTSFQSLLPKLQELPFNLDVYYQPCLALIYEDKKSTPLPFSFIVLDGLFPCLMPYVREDPIKENESGRKYILTHGRWTIMGSYKTTGEAKATLAKITDHRIETQIKPNCEYEIERFIPGFKSRFKYCGWQGAVLAKIKTNKEFRSAITFEENKIIHIIPGKVSNIFDVASEVKALITNKNVKNIGGYKYVTNGVLDRGAQHGEKELTEPVSNADRNTCELQTFDELLGKAESENYPKL